MAQIDNPMTPPTNREGNAAYINLRTLQQQLDADGCMVGVSRQALDETLDLYDVLLSGLKDLDACYCEASDDMSRAQRDHGRRVLIAARAAIAKAKP